jgi:metal-responsive CopG/Arc/MetJ family transcriptional regulator
MQNTVSVGISFPKFVIEKIDNERGDVSRSKCLLRIVQRSYLDGEKRKDY